ncbi:MAG: hypothetical protein P8181_07630 [bacterium]
MSTLKTSVLAVGIVIAAVVVFFASGADQLIASASGGSVCPAAAGDASATGKSASSCTKTAAAACPAAMAGSGCGKSCAVAACSGKKTGSAAVLAPIREHEGTRMVLTGRYVCGSCDLGIYDTCQAAFRTTDGKNYLLVTNNLSKELRQTAREKDVEIVTHVQKFDGTKYLEVDVVKTL